MKRRTQKEKVERIRTTKFLSAVEAEVASARDKFPTDEHQLAALVEEVGELAQALINHDRLQKGSGGSPALSVSTSNCADGWMGRG